MNFGIYGPSRGPLEMDTNYFSLADETKVWAARVNANGGGFTNLSVGVANALILAIQNSTFNSKIIYLLPLLGTNLLSALVPLRDSLTAGVTTANPAGTPLTNSAFSETTGITGTGAGNLTLPFKWGSVGGGTVGGFGYWAKTVDQSGTVSAVIGILENVSAERYYLDLRNTTANNIFSFGLSANIASLATNATPGDFYGQCASITSRTLYKDGSAIATNSTSDPTRTNINAEFPRLMGSVSSGVEGYAKGQCYCFYATDGTLTTTEIANLHTLLNTYLISPLGR